MRKFIKFSIFLLAAFSSLLIACGSGSDSSDPDPSGQVYIITFDANGGSGGPAPIDAVFGEPMPPLSAAVPTQAGFLFAGYYDAKTGGTMYYTADLTSARDWDKEEDSVLYAHWTDEIEIIFHKNDGSNEQKTQTVKLNVATALEANTFIRTGGYTFLGWALDSAATSATYLDKANYTATTPIVNLYAVWTNAPLRTITFHKNDGFGESVTQQVPENTTSNLAMNTFTRVTHGFIGWSDTSSGGVVYLDGAEYLMGTSNVSLYAVWANKRIITFHGNGGSVPIIGDVTKTQEALEGIPIALEANTFAREGYSFTGWSLTSTGVVAYADGADYPVTSDIDLYAVWGGNNYTITFNANGGTGGQSSPVTAIYGSPMPAITPAPTQTGFSFIGYFDAPTGGTMYYTKNLESAKEWDKADNTVLYAQWFLTPEMVLISDGTFQMGSPVGEPDRYAGRESPQHQVILTTGFYIGKYEVTQELYMAVMETNPSALYGEPAPGEIQGRRPVEMVSWYDALVFCNKLSVIEGFTPAYSINDSTDPDYWGSQGSAWDAVAIVSDSTGYRLPTEAQWEYACRAGTTTAYYTGTTIAHYTGDPDDNIGWYDVNSGGARKHEVGLKSDNAWGLYDMSGNVSEWCWDWYSDTAYGDGSVRTDPTGPISGSDRVHRGGNWNSSWHFLRSAWRGNSSPGTRYGHIGFRVVRPEL